MKQSKINLPIFPLPVFLLPDGVTKLRIFEPRYLKMIRIASQGQGFVILLNDNNLSMTKDDIRSYWGSWVEIINFDQGDDGVLEIDVRCKSLVDINNIKQYGDELHFGDVELLEHWSQGDMENNTNELSTSLESFFKQMPILNAMYEKKSLSNTHWVLARWLEILPIDINVKNSFVVNRNFQEVKTFVESVILN
jgi:Lon protease-like protein